MSGVIVENNLVWANQSIGIYHDGSLDGTVRNNIVIGTTDTTYHKSGVQDGRTWNPAGIGLNQEVVGRPTKRNKIYNNVCIGCGTGLSGQEQRNVGIQRQCS